VRRVIRRAIQSEHQERDQSGKARASSPVLDERADRLRWALGDSGTHYEWIMRQRITADVAKTPALGGGR